MTEVLPTFICALLAAFGQAVFALKPTSPQHRLTRQAEDHGRDLGSARDSILSSHPIDPLLSAHAKGSSQPPTT